MVFDFMWLKNVFEKSHYTKKIQPYFILEWETYKERIRFLEKENIALIHDACKGEPRSALHSLWLKTFVFLEVFLDVSTSDEIALRSELDVFRAKERRWQAVEEELLSEQPDFKRILEVNLEGEREEFELQNAKALKILEHKDEEITRFEEEKKQWESFMERGEERWRMTYDDLRNAEERQQCMLLDLQALEP